MNTESMESEFFAMCPRGLEAMLADELRELGATAGPPTGGGVPFTADTAVAYGANLRSRLASRVLQKVGIARYRNDDDLYKLAARTPWETLVASDHSLRVDVTAMRSPLRSLNFATLRIKDGIVDRLRNQTGQRPSIDTRSPDTRVFGFLDERHVTLYLDWSGPSLFKRGWRAGDDTKGAAPLKENLAAGLVALSGWTPDQPLFDPFCGSGTIVIEAAQRALGIAPGIARHFAFETLKNFDAPLWQQVREQARREERGERGGRRESAEPGGSSTRTRLRIAAADIDQQAVQQTRQNLRMAGVEAAQVRVQRRDFALAKPPFDEPGVMLCNPPYGERLQVKGRHGTHDIPEAGLDMSRFADTLKRHFGGWRLCMLTSDLDLPRRLGMKEKRKIPLFNGPLECRLFVFEIFGGEGSAAQ